MYSYHANITLRLLHWLTKVAIWVLWKAGEATN